MTTSRRRERHGVINSMIEAKMLEAEEVTVTEDT